LDHHVGLGERLSTLQGVIGASGISLASALGYIYRRFRNSGINELESFSRFVTQGVKYYVGRYVRRQLAAEFTLRLYARINLENTATEMLVPARYPVRLKVDKVFIPLLLRGPTGQTLEYGELLDRKGARLVLIGEPGSGKSSLMKRLYRDACRNANRDPRHSPLPILFGLSELSQLPAERLTKLTHGDLFERSVASVADSAVFKASDAVEQLKHGPGYLILFDGLDEVPNASSSQVIVAITELARRLAVSSPGSSLIVTTRTQHYVATPYRDFKAAFGVLTIRPFLTADVYRFLLAWPFAANRKANIARLFSRIRQLPSLSEMCTNPLALSMLVAQDQQTETSLSPETRSEFYAALVDELIVNRRLRAEQVAIGRQRLRADRSQILGEACLSHLLDSSEARNSVPESRLADAVLRLHPDADTERYVADLAVETGLFSEERKGETVRFLHLSLCEFLAAHEVVDLGIKGWQELTARLAQDSSDVRGGHGEWTSRVGEIIAFAAGTAPRELRSRIMNDLYDLDDHGLLLRAAVEAQEYEDPRMIGAISAECGRLAGIAPNDWGVLWFSRLRLVIAVLRDIYLGARSEIPSDAYRQLPTPAEYLTSLIDRHEAGDLLLGTLARQDASAAVAIAESSGRAELLEVVAAAADDVSVAVGILARCEAGRMDWCRALLSAALHQRTIAATLISLRDETPERGERGNWGRTVITGGSAYGRLLDEAFESADGRYDSPAVAAIRKIAPPRAVLPIALRTIIMRPATMRRIIPFLGIVIAGVVQAFIVGTSHGVVQWVFAGIGILGVVAVVMLIGFRAELRIDIGSDLDTPERRSSVMARVTRLVLGTGAGLVIDRASNQSISSSLFWRQPVLEEILNLGRFAFGSSDWPGGDDVAWRPNAVVRVFGGVPRADAAALIAVRQSRRQSSRDVSGASPSAPQ
jgi:hypothetical protein